MTTTSPESTTPTRPRRFLVCKCGEQGQAAPDSPVERWTCPRCLSASDRTDRDWRGEGAGQ